MRRRAMVMLAWCAGAGLSPGVPAFAKEQAPTMSVDGGWGPVALAVVDLEKSRYVGSYVDPAWGCDRPDVICHDGSMQEAPGRIVSIVARSAGFEHRAGRRFRRPGPHAARSVAGATYLALIEQTEQGYYWMAWSQPESRRRYCVPETLVTKFAIALPARARRITDEKGDICHRL